MTTDAALATPSSADLSFSFAQAHGVLLIRHNDHAVVVHKPGLRLAVLTELRRFLDQPLQLQEVTDSDFQRQLTQTYQRDNKAALQAAEELDADIDLDRLVDDLPETGDLMDMEDDAPVIRLINALLSQAVREKASDIHIETFAEKLTVRFRIDGVLNEVLSPTKALAPLVVSRLKVMAKLDIAEKRVPQDGRISIKLAGYGVDVRVSTLPSAYGERVVLRLLDQQAGQLELKQLRMDPAIYKGYTHALKMPHGIILVTGPTGSGKTTTLYAGLTHINDVGRNILTIEDPVEYLLPGIGQTQVNNKVDMSFARGLRAILRQDPDVVMVGEIRDKETAHIAVQASLTGHLVLSTLHTNTAVGAITRLQDMGIESFLLSSSLLVVMAQRLIRLLCSHCKVAYSSTAEENTLLESEETLTLYRAEGCTRCHHSGYRGRTAIYELITIDETLVDMIHQSQGEQAITAYARQHTPSIVADGQRWIKAGETTVEEVLRVIAV